MAEPVVIQTKEYQLTWEEAYQAFYLLAKVGSRRLRGTVLTALALLGAALTVMYGLRPMRLDYQLMAILCVVTFVAMAWAPSWKARKGARQVELKGGFYSLGIGEGFVATPDGDRHPLSGDRRAKAFETPGLFVIRPSRAFTFCLPKRVLAEGEAQKVSDILSRGVKNFASLGEGQ
ncbi:MAG: hypothetical protein LBU69_06640 [Deltaproteobacteria bacterium]|jgi:hypothetical protein|nr:hypothetical protein [Deltaproteobacteria bacterium]